MDGGLDGRAGVDVEEAEALDGEFAVDRAVGDAPGGLVVKEQNGDPYLLGLDSGCVYGSALSAYILEEQHLLQVKSQQAPDAWRQRGA